MESSATIAGSAISKQPAQSSIAGGRAVRDSGLLVEPLPAFGSQAARTMTVTAGARRPVSVLAVWTMEQIGAQRRCTTGSKLPEHLQLVGAQVEQMEQNG